MDAIEILPRPEISAVGLKELFQDYLPQDFFKRESPLKVLSVGCGTAEEAKVLTELCPNVDYYGMDTDENSLAIAKRNNSNIPSDNFQVGDAANYRSYRSMDFDVIIFRNSNLPEGSLAFEVASNYLNPRGVLMITNTTGAEQQRVLSSTSRIASLAPEAEERNRRIHKEGLPRKDQFVATYRKK